MKSQPSNSKAQLLGDHNSPSAKFGVANVIGVSAVVAGISAILSLPNRLRHAARVRS